MKAAALEVGFGIAGIANLGPATRGNEFQAWLRAGRHEPMEELEQGLPVRLDPRLRHPWARSVVSLALRYDGLGAREETPEGRHELERIARIPVGGQPMPRGCGNDVDPDRWRSRDPGRRRAARELIARSPALGVWPWIARYERDASYHRINDGKLDRFVKRLGEVAGRPVRVQDSIEHGAFFERDFAVQGGVGWWGKNNLVINPELGSFFVLTSVFTDLDLEPDEPLEDRCLSCRLCLDACPTGALDGPHNMVIERCIGARTISIDGPVPPPYAAASARVSGCDICQDVCPFNGAHGGREDKVGPAPERWAEVSLLDLLASDEAERLLMFEGSLVARIPLHMLHRNACLVAARIFRAAAGAPPRETLDRIARQVSSVDLAALRTAVSAHASSKNEAVREAAARALSAAT